MDKRLLRVRRKAKRKKPSFNRQEYFKHKRLGKKWLRPRGNLSKLRMREKARGKRPGSGFRSPKSVRGLSPSGLPEVRIFNPADLGNIQNKSVIIASTVGKKKRALIAEKARERGIKISNI